MWIRGLVVIGLLGAGCWSTTPSAPVITPYTPRAPSPPADADLPCDAKLDAEHCVRLGVRHEALPTVPKDDPVARRYFTLACDGGSARGCLYAAQDLLAVVLNMVVTSGDREVAARDLADAMPLAERGCELGHREACDYAGLVSAIAFGASKDPTWQTAACKYGAPQACEDLLRDGQPLPATRLNLIALHRRACKDSIAAACLALPALIEAEHDTLLSLVAAVRTQDTPAFAHLVADRIEVSRLAEDVACADVRGEQLTAANHRDLLACLATLGLRVERPSDPLASPILVDRRGDEVLVYIARQVVAALGRKPPPGQPPQSLRGNGPMNVAPRTLDANRIAGNPNLTPYDADKAALAHLGLRRMTGSFKVCIDTAGEIAKVDMLKSTGWPGYDRVIERSIFAWRYRPFLIDGQPAPVCTAVTFIYSQS